MAACAVPGLLGARPVPRADLHCRLDDLRTLRNRIARHLAADHDSVLLAAGWVPPGVRTWIEAHSRVPRLLALPRDKAARTF